MVWTDLQKVAMRSLCFDALLLLAMSVLMRVETWSSSAGIGWWRGVEHGVRLLSADSWVIEWRGASTAIVFFDMLLLLVHGCFWPRWKRHWVCIQEGKGWANTSNKREEERERKEKEKAPWQFRLILGRFGQQQQTRRNQPSDGLLVQAYCLQQAPFNTTQLTLSTQSHGCTWYDFIRLHGKCTNQVNESWFQVVQIILVCPSVFNVQADY